MDHFWFSTLIFNLEHLTPFKYLSCCTKPPCVRNPLGFRMETCHMIGTWPSKWVFVTKISLVGWVFNLHQNMALICNLSMWNLHAIIYQATTHNPTRCNLPSRPHYTIRKAMLYRTDIVHATTIFECLNLNKNEEQGMGMLFLFFISSSRGWDQVDFLIIAWFPFQFFG